MKKKELKIKMFSRFIVVLAISSFIYADSPYHSIKQDIKIKEAINLIKVWLDAQKDYEEIPGISMAIVHDQELLYSGGFGFSNPSKKIPANSKTIYSICSISKLFTSIAILQLRDKQKLQLRDPLKNHLPWFNINNAYAYYGQASVQSILTHSSGLPRESDYPYWSSPDFPFPSSQQIKDKLSSQNTLYPANKYFQYSNLGLTLAGEIVSEVSGLNFDTYISKFILGPLKMKNTRTYMPKNLYGKKLAIGHTAKNRKGGRSIVPLFDPQDISPAAGFSSSVEDLAKFASWQFRILQNKKDKVLEPNTLREMYRVHWLDDDWDPAWGLGFAVWRENEKKFVGHGGNCPGYRSSFIIQPDSKISAIFMANANGLNAGSYTSNIYKIISPAVEAALDSNSSDTILDSKFEKYIGSYLSLPWWGEIAIFPWEGGLAAIYLPTEKPTDDIIRLKHIKENTFKRIRKDGELGEAYVFDTDSEGIVTRLKMHSNHYPKFK